MQMTASFLITIFVLGLIGGFFSGLLGIGGGIIMVPLLLYIPPILGLSTINMKIITGITMVQSLAGSLSSLTIHRRNRFVHKSLVLYMGIASILGALIGSIWSKQLSGNSMLAIFAGLAVLASVMLFFPVQKEIDEETLTTIKFNRGLTVSIGFGVGLLGGILGQGGAFLIIPLMIYILHIPTRIALGSSVAISFLTGLAGFLGKWGTKQITFSLALCLALGAVIGAQFGGRLCKRVQTSSLRRILGLLIAGTAIRITLSLFDSVGVKIIFPLIIGIAAIIVILYYYSKLEKETSNGGTKQDSAV